MYFFYTNNAVLFGCTIRWKTLLSACWRIHNQNKFVFILWQVCSKEGQDTLLFACICTIHYSCIIRTRNKERSIFTPSLLRFLDHVYLCIIEKMTMLCASTGTLFLQLEMYFWSMFSFLGILAADNNLKLSTENFKC